MNDTTAPAAGRTTDRVELDYASSMYSANPLLDAEAWVGTIDADVEVSMVTERGPAGGHPVLAFEGAPSEVRKVLEDYFHDDPPGLAQALDALTA